jgi:hypothetical protein
MLKFEELLQGGVYEICNFHGFSHFCGIRLRRNPKKGSHLKA